MRATIVRLSSGMTAVEELSEEKRTERWLYGYGCAANTVTLAYPDELALSGVLSRAYVDSKIVTVLHYEADNALEVAAKTFGLTFPQSEEQNEPENPRKKNEPPLLPEGAVLLHKESVLPEFYVQCGKCTVFFLVRTAPVEAFLEAGIFAQVRRKVFKLCGLTRVEVVSGLSVLLDKGFKKYADYYIYDNGGLDILLSICLKPRKRADAVYEAGIDQFFGKVCRFFQSNIYAERDISLEEVLLELLKVNGYALGVAESLTGGLICDRIVSLPGASEVFYEGAVTYAGLAKTKRLGVSEATLRQCGAVSSETADAMVRGVYATGVDVAIATTGLAGPSGGEGKPVGLTYIAVCHDNRSHVFKLRFHGSRAEIRLSAANAALFYAICCVTNRNLYTGLTIA